MISSKRDCKVLGLEGWMRLFVLIHHILTIRAFEFHKLPTPWRVIMIY